MNAAVVSSPKGSGTGHMGQQLGRTLGRTEHSEVGIFCKFGGVPSIDITRLQTLSQMIRSIY